MANFIHNFGKSYLRKIRWPEIQALVISFLSYKESSFYKKHWTQFASLKILNLKQKGSAEKILKKGCSYKRWYSSIKRNDSESCLYLYDT